MTAPLLIELLTEELPPKSLLRLANAFRDALLGSLKDDGHISATCTAKVFATPRRLAVLIDDVHENAPDSEVLVKGPSVKAGLDASGKPTQALLGFAKKRGVAVEVLQRISDGKQEIFAHRDLAKGGRLDTNLDLRVEAALEDLPVPKMMRWGSGDAQFVRPVHGLVMLHGDRLVAGRVLGIESSTLTSGHRFMGKSAITLKNADEYEARLKSDGMVIADFAARRAEIEQQLQATAKSHGASLGEHADLLDEVTALVEHPSVYAGTFDAAYLDVPQECLILTMRQNQKYFPLFDAGGRLLPRFLIVSNMQVADSTHIVGGNQRVVRPRLDDARFFYNQDRRVRLEERVPLLARMVYHNKLGSQLERVERIQLLAGEIARALGANAEHAERAAWLAKADLLTGMVGEFPELQGIMGRYYARNDGEPEAVCAAIGDQYLLRLNDLGTPENLVSACLYLADRIDTLVGLFGIGEKPTGEKDPFALRRAALGTIRTFDLIVAVGKLSGKEASDVRDFLAHAASLFPAGLLTPKVVDEVHEFILERVWNDLATIYPKDAVEAVVSQRPKLAEVTARVKAVQDFRELPEADSLSAANKRIRNILRKSDAASGALDEALLKEPAEKSLYDSMRSIEPQIDSNMLGRDYSGALKTLAGIRGGVDKFFDDVMVNVEDSQLRANRHALLRRLDALMNRVADISKLAG
ncbi:MAG: glycine--tRNA ligase subunit beta [Betaproteobacteria bacterium RBG_16_64_18]|nr:MAG: glycine--tRNA ligase subunit beta [Betaproteobacteria bacterium RBG_16_64_18]